MQTNINETGRSMVEILGVLAIIGILSLGSVWLYDYASKFYEANHIQDSLGKAKNLADVNQSPTHIREVERLLRQTVGQYNPQIQQTEIRNPDTDGQKMTYTVTLQEVDERVCQLTMNKKDVLSSVNITIMAPASADECDSGMDMAFAFDTIRTDIVCQNDSDCAGTNNPFCKKGQCKACEPSDCSGTEPICNKYSGACEPCSNDDECHPNKCATNGSCGECSSNEHCTDEFRPICDTYEGVCKPCATDGDCEPKYCAGNGTCGDCSAHPHCPNTKPKCDSELGVCEACPTGTPFWKADEEKCITCYASNSATPVWNGTKCVSCYTANSAKPHWNGTQCTACPTATPVWSTAQNKCVNCYTADTTKPYWNGTQCTACPTATPVWSTAQNKCITCVASNSATPYWNGTQCVSCYTANSAKPYWNGTQCTTCPTATPVWSTTQNKCITCVASNSATPYWNGTQCVSCYTANSAKPYWNGTQCTTCPTATPYWNNTKQQCVKCLQNSHCSGTTPVCNSSNVCEACPSGYGFSSSQNKCVVQRTVTINNVGTKTTQIILDGETMAKPSASYPDFTFSHWSTTKDGDAVTFPLKVTSNITLYAYYDTPSAIEVGEKAVNYCGGRRLGSEYTYTSYDVSYSIPQKFEVKIRTARNNDGYKCKYDSSGWIGYKLDDVESERITSNWCNWISAGTGKAFGIVMQRGSTKYCDVVYRVNIRRTPQISYPY